VADLSSSFSSLPLLPSSSSSSSSCSSFLLLLSFFFFFLYTFFLFLVFVLFTFQAGGSLLPALVALLCVLGGTQGLNVTKVMTFNVLCEVCDVTNYGRWRDRLPYLADVLARHEPDIIGFQEPIDENNVQQLQAMIPDHVPLFFNRPRMPSYPDACIFYNPTVSRVHFCLFVCFLQHLFFSFSFFSSIFKLFKVVDYDVYWLSDTPDRPYSMGWVFSLFRVVIWARMVEISSNQEFIFSSTHFDNNGGNKENTVKLFLDRNRPFVDQNLPIIAVGDYNK